MTAKRAAAVTSDANRAREAQRLPKLLDAKSLADELGVTRFAAEKIMQQLPSVSFPDLRKVYVRREDARRFVDERTYEKDEVPS